MLPDEFVSGRKQGFLGELDFWLLQVLGSRGRFQSQEVLDERLSLSLLEDVDFSGSLSSQH